MKKKEGLMDKIVNCIILKKLKITFIKYSNEKKARIILRKNLI